MVIAGAQILRDQGKLAFVGDGAVSSLDAPDADADTAVTCTSIEACNF